MTEIYIPRLTKLISIMTNILKCYTVSFIFMKFYYRNWYSAQRCLVLPPPPPPNFLKKYQRSLILSLFKQIYFINPKLHCNIERILSFSLKIIHERSRVLRDVLDIELFRANLTLFSQMYTIILNVCFNICQNHP